VKVVKVMKINPDKCTGCRLCEAICSASHAEPKYSEVNPKRSRVRVFCDEGNDVYYPILAGAYTDAECVGRNTIVIKGKGYSECSFCRCSCPSRSLFKEADTDISLKCDMCEGVSSSGPLCVQYCLSGALTYVEREEED